MSFNLQVRKAASFFCIGWMAIVLCTINAPQNAQAQGYQSNHGYWMAYRTESEGKFYIYKDGQTESPEFPWRGYANMFDNRIAQNKPIGVGGYVQTKGKVRPWYRWIRRTIPQFNGYYVAYVPDPNDNPPAVLKLAVLSVATCNSASDWNESNYTYGPNRKPNTEYVSIDIVGETDSGHDSGGSTAANFRVDKIIPVAAGGAMEISPEGYEVVHGPWLDVDVKVGLLGNRYVGSDSGSVALGGLTSLQVSFVTEAQNYWAASPDPYGLALALCPDPAPQAPLNQYVMTGGGGIFTVPTTVSYTGSSQTFYNRLLNGLDWTVTGATPSPMLPHVSNGSTTFSGNSTSLFPQHVPSPATTPVPQPLPVPNPTPNPAPTPIAGLAFENVLPVSNVGFGANSITHSFEGASFAVSNFALFYQANTYTHPAGSSRWCGVGGLGFSGHLRPDVIEYGQSPIPNWFHYYSQAWTPPCSVAFTTGGSNGGGESFFDTTHPDHVHINYDANGTLGRNIYESRYDSLLGVSRMTQVGNKTFYGIDAYASSVTHEYGHMTAYNARQVMNMTDSDNNGYPDDDNDGDGLPNSLEVEVGLNPNRANTTQTGKSDEEVYCDIKQRNAQGPRELDWANNGLNWGRVPGQCPQNRSPISYFQGMQP